MTLTELLQDPALKSAVVADCVRFVEDEVAARRGLSGAALRAGYAAFQKLRPGITRAAFERLLPHFAPAMDPHWQRGCAAGDPDRWFRDHAPEVADDLLAVTDRLATESKNRVLVRLYRSLRGHARDHVVASVPRLPPLVARHLPRPGFG